MILPNELFGGYKLATMNNTKLKSNAKDNLKSLDKVKVENVDIRKPPAVPPKSPRTQLRLRNTSPALATSPKQKFGGEVRSKHSPMTPDVVGATSDPSARIDGSPNPSDPSARVKGSPRPSDPSSRIEGSVKPSDSSLRCKPSKVASSARSAQPTHPVTTSGSKEVPLRLTLQISAWVSKPARLALKMALQPYK